MGTCLSGMAGGGGNASSDPGTVVCKLDDLEVGKMKEVKLQPGDRPCVLVREDDGRVRALSGKCTHYGAPLAKGSYSDGKVRCPWHGACFDAATGDIEDFPGLDSLQVFDVTLSGEGEVRVRSPPASSSSPSDAGATRRVRGMARRDGANEAVVVVVGGGGAGQACVEALRQDGFTGRLVLITKEPSLPYDRPKLSKALSSSAVEIRLRNPAFYEEADIEVMTGTEATSLSCSDKVLKLSTGEELKYDRLVLATGSRPRTLEGVKGGDAAEGSNVFVLRTPEDGNAIAAAAKGKKVVVVGTSFIGMEVAAYLSSRAASVTVVGTSGAPFARSLGEDVGRLVQGWHEKKGVRFVLNSGVQEILTSEEGKVSAVVLKGGKERLEADAVVLGVGAAPNTAFLQGSGLELDRRGFVRVNDRLEATGEGAEGVYAAGDIAAFPLACAGGKEVSIGHWQLSMAHGRCAALNVSASLSSSGEGKRLPRPLSTVPFFWTQQYGKSVRYAGYDPGEGHEVVVDGSVEEGEFVAYYCSKDKGEVTAVATLGRDPTAARFANLLAAGKKLRKEDALTDWQKDY